MRKKLSQTLASGDAPIPEEIVIWDTEIRGFGLRCQTNGRKTYFVQYRLGAGGRNALQKKVILGRYPTLHVAEARRKAIQIVADAANGIDHAAIRDEERASPTVRKAAAEFIAEYVRVNLKESTQREYIRIVNNEIVRSLGTMKISDVGVADVHKMHASKTRKRADRQKHQRKKGEVLSESENSESGAAAAKGSPTTANRIRATLSTFLRWAEFKGYRPLGSNVARLIKPNRERLKEHYLGPDQLADLLIRLEEAEKSPWRRDETKAAADLVRFLLYTGLRRSEALNLKWTDVTDDLSAIVLVESKTDAHLDGPRTVQLGEQAIALLRRQTARTDNPFVFPGGATTGIAVNAIVSFWRRLGVPYRLHDLRHTYASVMVTYAGATLAEVGEQLGHTSPITTARYAKLMPVGKQVAAEKASTGLAAILADASE